MDKRSQKKIREKREFTRIRETIAALVSGEHCTVIDVSQKGVLLVTRLPVVVFSIEDSIEFQLRIYGDWIDICGTIKWIKEDLHTANIGIFIRSAPEIYLEYLRERYS